MYHWFVPSFIKLSSPLNKELKKEKPLRFELDDTERKEVDVLKEKLITTPALALYRPKGQYKIETDACDNQTGCVQLKVWKNNALKPIDYWSHLLCGA